VAGLPAALAACGDSDDDEASGTSAAAPTSAAATTESSAPASEPQPTSDGGATSAATTEAASTAAASDVKRGGRLRVGHVGGGNVESFNPALGSTFVDLSRYLNLYDLLVRVAPDWSLEPCLAVEWEPNADGTIWTIRLRPDVTFHDGKPLTAADVIYTFRSWADEKHIAHVNATSMRLDELKAVDDLTVQVPLKAPNARLMDSFTGQNTVIIQDGLTDFSKPVGTGPFVFSEFTPGERSLCTANPDYWDEGKPYVDEWEDISIDDPAARLNALLGGEIDMLSQLEPTRAKVHLESGEIQVLRAPSTAVHVFLMRVDVAPFDNVKVRQAMRLIPNRQELIDRALLGFGTVANDLPGVGLWNFASDLPPRDQDIEAAKALLAEAGAEGLEVTLHTSDIVPGFVEAATLFAEQAKDAGVTVNVKKEAGNAYFDTSKLYTKLDFAQSFWTFGSLGLWYEQALISDAIWNETHFKDPEYDKLIRAAQGAPDEAQALELWHQVQQRQYDEGGYIAWANGELLDGLGNDVRGLTPNGWFNLGGYDYKNVWFDR
jgi:peptide/nickel transport system substrate-binding protein